MKKRSLGILVFCLLLFGLCGTAFAAEKTKSPSGLCGAVSYRKWKLILPLIGCCIPCIVYAGMYLLLG